VGDPRTKRVRRDIAGVWGGLARRVFGDAARFDPGGFRPGFAVRCTAGVALPLAVALLAGHPLAGVPAAIGALSVGFASRQGVYRTRAAAMLLTAVAMAASAFVASTTAALPALNVAAAGIWGLAVGLLASLGSTATGVGLNACVALAVFSQFRYGPGEAGISALLVFAGGALQTLLLVSIWPLQRFTAERTVLAKAYRTLAAYADQIRADELRPPDQRPFTTLTATLADPQPFARRGEIAAFEILLDEAERIRAALGALAVDRFVLARSSDPRAAAVVELGSATSAVLGAVASALEAGRPPSDADGTWPALDATMTRIEGAGPPRTVEDARALLGQLRSAWRAAGSPADGESLAAPGRAIPLFRASAFAEALQTLRANCSPRSEYAQHAIRLGATLLLASLASQLFPLQRGYWVPLTVVLVLKPDFSATLGRGISRIAGTLLGAVVASIVVAVFRPQAQTYLVLAVAFAGLGYAVFDTNYALYTITITAYVVFLLAFGGLPEHAALQERIEATLVGGALALTAYALWPTWERELVPVRLAEMLERQRAYMALVLAAFATPAQRDDAAMHEAQMASWLARTNAEASVDRFLGEPVRPRAVSVRAALGMLAASRRAGLALLTLQAHVSDEPVAPGAKLEALRDGLLRSYDGLARALRDAGSPVEQPPLRELQIALDRELAARAGEPAASVAAETDLLVDSANTMADIIRRLRAAGG
jgi:uncharacterized membrane protein YccC